MVEMVKEPKYWKSKIGKVAFAIAIDGVDTWEGLSEHTGFDRDELNRALHELFEAKVLEKREDRSYQLDSDLVGEYKRYFEKEQKQRDIAPIQDDRDSTTKSSDWAKWIIKWRDVSSLNFSLEHLHFFLDEIHLYPFSTLLISRAESQVLVVNPYVEKCDLSDNLLEPVQQGKEVMVITRPASKRGKKASSKIAEIRNYLLHLDEQGLDVRLDDYVHAKLIVVDEMVAVVSSMNFYPGSLVGKPWEAGMVSIDPKTVKEVRDRILALKKTAIKLKTRS
jgi:phosphatidylserine/phosphatidylglycerophosphate/cardiolipin synthase-like enzyme